MVRIQSNIHLMSEAEASYVAGIVDGEAYLSLYRYNGHIRVRLGIANTSLELLSTVQKFVNGGRLSHKKECEGHRSVQWELNFGVNEIQDLLPQLMPFVVAKRDLVHNIVTYLGNRNKK